MPVPNTFGTATSAIPLSQLDANFNTPITIGNTAVQLGNTVTTLNNMTLANVTISSGNVTITNVAITTANVSGTANISTLVVVGNATVGGNTTITGNITAANANVTTNLVLSGGTANGVAYLNTSKVLTTGGALVFDGTNLGVGAATPTAKLQIGVASAAVDGTKGVRITNPAGTIVMLECGSGGDSFVGTESGSTFNIRTNNAIVTTFLSGGNVGFGETNPVQKLHFKGSSTTYALAETTGSGTSSGFRMKAGAGTDFTLFTTEGGNQFGIYNNTTSTQPLTIDASGNLLVGLTSPTSTERLSIWRDNVTTNSLVANIQNQAATSTSRNSNTLLRISSNANGADAAIQLTDNTANNYWFGGNNGGAYVVANSNGVRLANGGTSWASDSDERIKDIIEPILDAANKVLTLRAVIGKYKTDKDGTRRSFLIAQDVQAVLPEAVFDEQGTLMLAYTDTIPLLVAAIQEQQALITQLTARITALEGA